MSEIRAQIKALVDAQVASITNTTQNEVQSLLSS